MFLKIEIIHSIVDINILIWQEIKTKFSRYATAKLLYLFHTDYIMCLKIFTRETDDK